MLCVSIGEGDYVLIGDNIKVHFNRTKGKDLVLGIEAPREVAIQRCQIYEKGLEQRAFDGNNEAKELAQKLKQEHAERRNRYDARRLEKKERRNTTAAS